MNDTKNIKSQMITAIANIKQVLREAELDIMNDDERNMLSAYKTVSVICQALTAMRESQEKNETKKQKGKTDEIRF